LLLFERSNKHVVLCLNTKDLHFFKNKSMNNMEYALCPATQIAHLHVFVIVARLPTFAQT